MGWAMDESVRARLFEPFFTTQAGKGTGIGLATVHDIVSSNGGLIQVQSEVRRGTRISVLRPIIVELPPESLQETSFHPHQTGKYFHSNPGKQHHDVSRGKSDGQFISTHYSQSAFARAAILARLEAISLRGRGMQIGTFQPSRTFRQWRGRNSSSGRNSSIS